MGKEFKAFKEDDIGAMGIGAMIIFIAMVLVAGIAASVLVQTANNLQIRAMETGTETTAEVSTGLYVVTIDGNVTGSQIDKMSIMVKLRAGSRDIDLNKTIIEISDGVKKCVLFHDGLSYSVGTNGTFNQSVYALNGSEFGIIKLIDVDGSITQSVPVMNRGDCVLLTINTTHCFIPGGLSSREDVWGQVIPEEGGPAVFSFRVPASLVDTVYRLY
jgi:flagellin FlaB